MSYRVLHCPTSVGNNPYGLASAERAIGLDSTSWTTSRSGFAYPTDRDISAMPVPCASLRHTIAGFQSLRYDIIHYNFGSSFGGQRWDPTLSHHPFLRRCINACLARWTEHWDVRVAARLGRGIFVTFQGDDARQGDVCRARFPVHFVHEVGPGYYSPASDRWKRERIARFDRLAAGIFAVNPDLLHVLPARAEFIPYAHVDPRDWRPVAEPGRSHEPHVVHAPSNRAVKGTRHILAALDRLRSEGIRFRLTLVEGMANAEARRIYASADLVVDQLLAGWYGGLAVECMALGVPVIAYIRDEDLGFIPAQMRTDLPLISAHPGTIESILRHWLTAGRADLAHRGLAARSFVERWHDPQRIAGMMKERYERILVAGRRAPL